MKHLVRDALVTVLGIGLVGCEWGGSGDSDTWNSRFDFANFSGNYRGNGGYLVSEYTAASSTGGGASGEQNIVDEVVTNISGGVSFGANTVKRPIKPGSFTLNLNGGTDGSLTDDGAGNLSGKYLNGVLQNAVGTVSYDNGAFSVRTVIPITFPAGLVTVTYTYLTGAGTSTSASSTPGSSVVEIFAFNVMQQGNKLSITDNNGRVYEGKFSSISTTGGTDQDTGNPRFNSGDQVIGQFEAKGTSAADIAVKMIGSFQATIANVNTSGTTTTLTLTDRRILGTWIEDGGKTGDINGVTENLNTSTTP